MTFCSASGGSGHGMESKLPRVNFGYFMAKGLLLLVGGPDRNGVNTHVFFNY